MYVIIPARGGSKGLPGKNLKLLNGKPLIAYSIEAAKKAKNVDRIIVSTDDKDIAEVAISYGAEVPFLRPKHLSEDNSSAVDVYIHAIEYLNNNTLDEIKEFLVLLPTNPLRNHFHINDAIELFKKESAKTLISVKETDIPPTWYCKIKEKKLINAGLDHNKKLANRQEYEKYYIPNGAIYILNYEILKNKRTYYSDNTIAFVMENSVSIDIDTIDDFYYAEYLLSKLKS